MGAKKKKVKLSLTVGFEDPSNFGLWLRALRIRRGLSKDYASFGSGISTRRLTELESGFGFEKITGE